MSNKWLLSATEIDTFETCERKWAYQYIDAIETSPSKAAEFGLKVHKFLENYLTGYEINYETPEGRVIKPGLHYLPKNLSKENVEKPFFFLLQGHIFHGYIDFFEQVGSQIWVIGDHKTCSNFSHIPSPIELKANIQANVYATWAFVEKKAEKVVLRWVYYKSQGKPKSISVEAELTPDEAASNFKRIKKAADNIKNIIREKLPSSSLKKNLTSCFKYGRCAFYSHCKNDNNTSHLSYKKHKEGIMIDSEKNNENSFHLFVDCLPVKNAKEYKNTIELSELLKPVLEKIKNDKELKHYRLAGYGQHVGLISSYLGEYLRSKAFDQNTAIVSSAKTPEGCDTLQTLIAEAGSVVRGF